MLWTDRALPDQQGAREVRHRLRIVSLQLIGPGEIVERERHARIVRAESLLANRQHPPIDLNRLVDFSRIAVEQREIVERRRDFRVLRAECALLDRQGTPVE